MKTTVSSAHQAALRSRVQFAVLKGAIDGISYQHLELDLLHLRGLPFGTVSIDDRAEVDWVIAEEVARGEWN